jgi:hypothetical protein
MMEAVSKTAMYFSKDGMRYDSGVLKSEMMRFQHNSLFLLLAFLPRRLPWLLDAL